MLFRSKKEFKLLFRLNQIYLDGQEEFTIDNYQGGTQSAVVTSDDYQDAKINVIPVADPTVISDSQKMNKVQAIMAIMQMGTVNPKVITEEYLEAIGCTNIQELTTLPPPQPNFEQQIEMQKVQGKNQYEQAKVGLEQQAINNEHIEALKKLQLEVMQLQGEMDAQRRQHELDKAGLIHDIMSSMADNSNTHIEHRLKHMEILHKPTPSEKNKPKT